PAPRSFSCFPSTPARASLLSPLSLHAALPSSGVSAAVTLAYAGDGPFLERMVSAHMTQNAMKNENAVISGMVSMVTKQHAANGRSEEHTSELQSRFDLVCCLLLAQKNDSSVGG